MTSRESEDAVVGQPAPVTGIPRGRVHRAVRVALIGFHIGRRTLGKAWQDRILGMSAESAFWQLLSLPSMLIALLGLLGYATRWLGSDAVGQMRDWALSAASKVVTPQVVDQVVAPVVSQILDHNRTDVIGIGTIIALWSGSSATATFVNTITIAYGQRDLRGALRSRLVSLKLYLFTVLAGVVVLPAVVLGPGMLDRLFTGRWHDVISGTVHVLYWPVLGLVVFAGITTFYHLATPIRLRWRRAFPGALAALALFLGMSYGLQLYVTAIATNLRVYATLAAPILTLMYFYALGFAVLLGAEFNATLEERWPRGRSQRPGTWLRKTANRVRHRYANDPPAAEPDPNAPETPDGGDATPTRDLPADAGTVGPTAEAPTRDLPAATPARHGPERADHQDAAPDPVGQTARDGAAHAAAAPQLRSAGA